MSAPIFNYKNEYIYIFGYIWFIGKTTKMHTNSCVHTFVNVKIVEKIILDMKNKIQEQNITQKHNICDCLSVFQKNVCVCV